ncbi:hypothetical protein [Enterobacter cloacae]|uniref:hypothetical protein n=2 Tax=Enterobacter cloacae TaxID=550 RepID=UPI00295E8B86|nr:hypothetical protein [Enterobacter cloacae]MBZ5209380.1 hypothetical protein [Enterobacter cloacae subsp. cloacae]
MKVKRLELNRTTQLLGRLFPALLVFTPIISSAGTIDQSTSAPQDFSADTEYVINKDITVSSSGDLAAVSASGFKVSSITNNGNISGTSNGLDINTSAQPLDINNNAGATISSATKNAVNIVTMQGSLTNKGNITGFEKGIFVNEDSSAISISNTETGIIKGNTGLARLC